MAKPPVRPGVMARLATNFWNSIFRGRQLDQATKVVGDDIFGNRYYEIPADPSRGKRRGRRWFTNEASKHHDPRNHESTVGFDNEIPSEWDSWLRFRRDEPPTQQQVLQSYALAELKKVIYAVKIKHYEKHADLHMRSFLFFVWEDEKKLF